MKPRTFWKVDQMVQKCCWVGDEGPDFAAWMSRPSVKLL